MSRPIVRLAAIIQIGLILFTGCHPTQPFFIARDNTLGEYLDQAMHIEYADVQVESLLEATQAMAPLGPSNIPTDFVELSLEDCVSMALQNSKILRVVGGSSQQSGSVAAALLSAQPGQMPSVYDPAITATTSSTQAHQIDNNGNRVPIRGAARANQTGGVEDALSEFDTQFSTLFGYNTTDRPRNVGAGNIFNPQFFQAVDSNAQATMSKRMATGGVASARFNTVYSMNNIPASGNVIGSGNFGRSVPSDYTAALELQVTHPLLRGRGTLVNRIPVVLARINEDIQLHQFEGNVVDLVKAVEDAYWDLYAGYRVFEANRRARDAALSLWRVAQDRSQMEKGGNEAEAQARAQYYQFQSQIISSMNGSTVPGNDPRGLIGREQILREKIGWSATDGKFIRPSDDPTTARIEFNWNDVTAEGLTRNVRLRTQKWGIKQRQLELISAKNQILAQVDVTGLYRFVGVGDIFAETERSGLTFPSPGSNALEELTGGKYQELGARLEITPPALGSRRQLANIQSGYLQVAKSQEELKEKEMALIYELSFAWRNMQSTFEGMKYYLDQWQANEDEIKIYEVRLEEGVDVEQGLRQMLDNLLRAEQRRALAETQYYQSVSEYNKSIVSIHYYKGSLLDLNSIALQEGQWNDKAYWDATERARERESGIYVDYGYTRPAVVSRGPVEAGLPTEGNVARPGRLQPTAPEAEETEEGTDKESEELPKKAGDKTPVASFDWGNLGIDENQVDGRVPQNRAAVVTSSGSNRSRQISDSVAQPASVIRASEIPTRAVPTNSRQPGNVQPAAGMRIQSQGVNELRTNSANATPETQWRPKTQ